MKKNLAIFAIVLVFVLMAFGTSTAWQGRMAGMNDPYGLIQDESDMLIHPAMIMNSSGFRFYTHYRFTYTDVMDWDYDWNFSNPVGPGEFDYDFEASGDEYKSEALIGSAFNLGSGRMGVFFTYDNQFGDYDGEIDSTAITIPNSDFELDSKKHDFTLSFLYGFPIDCTDLGFEAGFAYHNEENETYQKLPGVSTTNTVFPITLFPDFFWSNINTYMIPYDSEYYEGFAKASIASELGCYDDFGFTVKGGYIFGGNNEIDVYTVTLPTPEILSAEMDGEVDGWSLGGDFWLRHKIDDTISLPFLVSINYWEITRDGDDTGILSVPVDIDYEHTATGWDFEFGGGIDVALNGSSEIAAGIYYRYLDTNNEFYLDVDFPASGTFYNNDMDDIPNYKEQRITLKLAYEKDITSNFAFLAGFDCFYGWADWDYENDLSLAGFGGIRDKVSMDGDIWGIGLTVGNMIKINPIILEPFIGFKYQQTILDGEGETRVYGAGIPVVGGGTNANVDGSLERDQWLVTGGLSLYF